MGMFGCSAPTKNLKSQFGVRYGATRPSGVYAVRSKNNGIIPSPPPISTLLPPTYRITSQRYHCSTRFVKTD